MVTKQLIKEWHDLQLTLKDVKKHEMALRKEICNDLLKGETLPARKKVNIEGLEVKAENGVTHNFDQAVLNELLPELSSAEKMAIKWSPELKLRVYKKLPEESLLHEAIIVKPSAPILTIL